MRYISCLLSVSILNYFIIKASLKKVFIASIRKMRLRLLKLQQNNLKVKKFRKNIPKRQKDIKAILYHKNFFYISKIIYSKIIGHHHNDSLVGHFGIKKTPKLIARKYFQPTLCQEIETYVKSYDIYLALKIVRYKLYKDLQLLPIPIHHLKEFFIDFIRDLPILVA